MELQTVANTERLQILKKIVDLKVERPRPIQIEVIAAYLSDEPVKSGGIREGTFRKTFY